MRTNRNKKYWADRAVALEAEAQNEAGAAEKRIVKLYERAIQNINEDIDNIFYEFARFQGLDADTAQNLITAAQGDKQYRELQQLLEAAEDAAEQVEIQRRINAQAYGARMSCLEAVKQRVYIELRKAAQGERAIHTALNAAILQKAYYTTIHDTAQGLNCGVKFSVIPTRAIEQLQKAQWRGSNYSDRVWNNNGQFISAVQKTIEDGITAGHSIDRMAQCLKSYVKAEDGKSVRYVTERLVRSETAHFMAEGQAQAYEDIGSETYRFLASLSERTCEVCGSLDGQTFRVSEHVPGVNYPPIHPNCRCTTIIGDFMPKTRLARDPLTGKNYKLDGSVTYEQWKDSLSPEQKQAMETHVKQMRNRSADIKQYEKYKQVLGAENVPKTFDKFVETKYNGDRSEYEKLKKWYREVGWQIRSQNNILQLSRLPNTNTPNSVIDKVVDGNIIQRRYYGRTGKPRLDFDLTDHGNPKLHPTVPHYHSWIELKSGEVQRSKEHDKAPEIWHIIANKDILR